MEGICASTPYVHMCTNHANVDQELFPVYISTCLPTAKIDGAYKANEWTNFVLKKKRTRCVH